MAVPQVVARPSQQTLPKEQGQSNSQTKTTDGNSNNTGEANVLTDSQVSDAKTMEPAEGNIGCEEPHKENAEETTKRLQDKLNEIVLVVPINSSGPSHNCAGCGGLAGFNVKKIVVNGWIKRLCVACTNKVLQQTFEELLALESKIA